MERIGPDRQAARAGIDMLVPLIEANDDMILEVAVADGCDAIVTHNVRDFTGAETFGIDVLTTKDFLKLIRSRK